MTIPHKRQKNGSSAQLPIQAIPKRLSAHTPETATNENRRLRASQTPDVPDLISPACFPDLFRMFRKFVLHVPEITSASNTTTFRKREPEKAHRLIGRTAA